MLYHPTIIALFAVILMIFSYKKPTSFKYIAIIFPIIMLISILFLPGTSSSVEISSITLSMYCDHYSILIGCGFSLMLLCANLYSINYGTRKEIILGSFYAALALWGLFADDFISIISSLELMMVFSSIIIFIGGYYESPRAAKKYFITHLISGNMIIVGIAYIFITTGSTKVINLSEIILNSGMSQTILSIMLTGLLINIAAFPFGGWMPDCYKAASASGFLYLISYTTKLSVIFLLKIFAGLEILAYVGYSMILYASFNTWRESNLYSLLCYMSMMQMGLMTIGISSQSSIAHSAVYIILFVHIIYKGLLAILASIIAEHAKTTCVNDLPLAKNNIIQLSIIIILSLMCSVPGTISFAAKHALSSEFSSIYPQLAIAFLSFLAVFVLPIYKFVNCKNIVTIRIDKYTTSSIYILVSTLLLSIIYGLIYYLEFSLLSYLKQIIIIVIGIAASYSIHTMRTHLQGTNILQNLGDYLLFFIAQTKRKNTNQTQEDKFIALREMEKRILSASRIMHNQQTAIFVVFTILTLVIISAGILP